VVVMRPGEYVLPMMLGIARPIAIEAVEPGTVIIDGRGGTRLFLIMADGVRLSGLVLQGGNGKITNSQSLSLGVATNPLFPLSDRVLSAMDSVSSSSPAHKGPLSCPLSQVPSRIAAHIPVRTEERF